jgi:hypothetical protein
MAKRSTRHQNARSRSELALCGLDAADAIVLDSAAPTDLAMGWLCAVGDKNMRMCEPFMGELFKLLKPNQVFLQCHHLALDGFLRIFIWAERFLLGMANPPPLVGS